METLSSLDRLGTDSAEDAGVHMPVSLSTEPSADSGAAAFFPLPEDTVSQLNGPDGRLMTIGINSSDGRLRHPCGSLGALEALLDAHGVAEDTRSRIFKDVMEGHGAPKFLCIDGYSVAVSCPNPSKETEGEDDITNHIVNGGVHPSETENHAIGFGDGDWRQKK